MEGWIAIKVLEENVSGTLSDINHRKILFSIPPRVMKIKTKISKWDLIKLRFSAQKKE